MVLPAGAAGRQGQGVVLQAAGGKDALRIYGLLLLTVAYGLGAVLCSYATIAWSDDRSQDPTKATMHITTQTCQTRMGLPAAASGWQGCGFVGQLGVSMLPACCCCCL